MTATLDRGPAVGTGARRRTGTGPFAGTGSLIRFNLRRDRIRIPVWLAAITLVQVAGAASYPDIYPTATDRQNQAAIIETSPAMKAMTGPGHGLDNYTYGAMIGNEFLSFMVIFVALMSVLMLVRHTRTEEETGRAELIRSSAVGRHAHLTAALATVAAASLALGLLLALGMGSLGIESVDWAGSATFGAAYAAVGLAFGGVAAIIVQITEHARAAAGMAGALIAVAYLLRALGDLGENALSWLSPIGWAQASAPYVTNRWWPLGLALAATVALVGVAFAVGSRRDLGSGLRTQRRGAASANPLLGTATGFAWRLQRSGVGWWTIAMLVFGASYGSAADIVAEYADNELVVEMVGDMPGETLVESWLSMVIALLAVVCTVFAIIAALRPRREETSGRAEPVLATALSRTRWLASHLLVGLGGGALLLLATGVGLGATAAAGLGDPGFFWQVVAAAVAYAPAVWATTGLAVAVFGLVPRVIGVAWALLGYAVLIIYLGGLLDLPGWAMNLSPYTHVARMPAESIRVLPLVVLTGIAVVLTAAGWFGFRRRDIDTT